MDDESKDLLRQLVDAQKEQTELLRKHVLPLWTRIRFSLLALFAIMTLMATGVGFTALAIRSMKTSTATTQAATIAWPASNAGNVIPRPISISIDGVSTDGRRVFLPSGTGQLQPSR